jgi:ubiquinone/menaquinone biosynthesis C-methylase UbiE
MATTAATAFDWSAVARAWDARRELTERAKHDLTEQLIAGLRVEPGARVLELGAGTGELASRLADVVGTSGRVHATDAAPGMADLITKTAGDRGNVDVSVVDAADTGLPPAAYDAVVFRMGLMF